MDMLFRNHAVLPHFSREPSHSQHEVELFRLYELWRRRTGGTNWKRSCPETGERLIELEKVITDRLAISWDFFQASTSLRSAQDFPFPSEAGQYRVMIEGK